MQKIRIATRESPLALWQAEYVSSALRTHHPELQVELVPMTTKGDQILDSPLAKVGGKGLFVKELERAMLADKADIAVHSMKDVPMEFPEGLGLAVICEREDPSDAFVSNHHASLEVLPEGSIVGTSSFRRQCQLKQARPDLDIRDLRGNVGTRLAKLDAEDYDAIILASAGLIRLALKERIRERLPFNVSLPAGGQGAVGIESRSEDLETLRLLQCLHHSETAARVTAERAVVNRLQGGCQVPIAAFAELRGETLNLSALVGSLDGQTVYRSERSAPVQEAEQLGVRVADELLQQGAAAILEALRD